MTLEAYRKLWPQRLAAASAETEKEMERLIAAELRDELTHPRVRKTYKKIAAQLD